MRRTVSLAPIGTDRRQLVLPNAWEIASVVVDNPSGSWLLLSTGDYIPPYTLGWALSFRVLLGSVDVLYRNGPAGQISSIAGDAPTVYLSSDFVGDSPGRASGGGAFVTRDQPPIIWAYSQNPSNGGAPYPGPFVIATPPAGQKIRLYYIRSHLSNSNGILGPINQGGMVDVKWMRCPAGQSSGTTFANTNVSDLQMTDDIPFAGGLDFNVDEQVSVAPILIYPPLSNNIYFLTDQTIGYALI